MAQATELKQAASGRIDMRSVQRVAGDQTAKLKERLDASAQSTERLQEISGKMQSAVKRGDVDEVALLTADFDTARKSYAQNTRDLAGAMMGLTDQFKDIGVTLTEAKNFSAEEQKIIDDGNAGVVSAQSELTSANNAWLFKSGRVASAERRLEAAKIALKTATETAEVQRRMRLENMNLEQSMQMLQTLTVQITQIATQRIDDITENLDAVESGAIATSKDLEQKVTDLEKLIKGLDSENAKLSSLNEELTSYIANSAEWTECSGRIQAETRKRDKVEADKNKIFALVQDAQRFIEMYKIQEESQRQMLSFHQTWIAMLQEGSRQRTVLYKSHLGVMQAAGDQQAMSMADAVAVETDERISADAVQHLSAIRGNTVARAERTPIDTNRLRQIQALDTQAQVAFEKKVEELQRQFHNNWGTAPGYDSRDTYREPAAQQPAA